MCIYILYKLHAMYIMLSSVTSQSNDWKTNHKPQVGHPLCQKMATILPIGFQHVKRNGLRGDIPFLKGCHYYTRKSTHLI